MHSVPCQVYISYSKPAVVYCQCIAIAIANDASGCVFHIFFSSHLATKRFFPSSALADSAMQSSQ